MQLERISKLTVRFLAILACNTSCTDRHVVKGMDPAAHTGDGFQDIIMVRTEGVTCVNLIISFRSKKFHILDSCDISFVLHIKHLVLLPCLTSAL